MTQIHTGRHELLRKASKVTLMGASLFASWAFAVSAVWGTGPFSWPSDAPELSIAAENITVDAIKADTPQAAGASVTAASANR